MKNAKKPIFILLLSIAALFFIINTSFSQQTAEQLFEKALYMEEAAGDLEQAIDLFQQILEDFPDNREFAAKSLLHLGICYEKQGLKKARGTYQDVINKYPDRQGEVALAKERLNRLLAMQEVPAKPTFRQIRIPTEVSWNIALSPDGQSILLVYDKKLWRMPLSGTLGPDLPGKPRHINTENVPVEWSGLAWSADGKWIAFNDILPQDSLKEQNWKQRLENPVHGAKIFFAEIEQQGIVGFALTTLEKYNPLLVSIQPDKFVGELCAIYVLKEFQNKKIGTQLIKLVTEYLMKNKIKSMIVWVLKQNPYYRFYEKMGGQYIGEQSIEIGGKKYIEKAYG